LDLSLKDPLLLRILSDNSGKKKSFEKKRIIVNYITVVLVFFLYIDLIYLLSSIKILMNEREKLSYLIANKFYKYPFARLLIIIG